MPAVTFACSCPQSHLEASIRSAADPGRGARLLFARSGKKTVELARGSYDIAYRAQGTPDTPFTLEVAGAIMRKVDRSLTEDGEAAGTRTLLVERA